jgi:signal transduction histidine kinase
MGLVFAIEENELFREIQATHSPLILPDAQADARFLGKGGTGYVRSWMGIPMLIKDRVIGSLTIDNLRPGVYTEADAQIAQAFAQQAAIAIENARLYQELRGHADQLEARVQERTAQLQAQYARLDAILRSTTDGIIVADAQGDIVQTNPVAQTWLAQALSPRDATRLRRVVQDLAQRAGERPKRVLELTGMDLELEAAPILEPDPDSAQDEPVVVVVVHDVSHLKALDRVKSRFITHVSHELRTPITTIKLYTELMRRRPEKREHYLDVLQQQADHQARLVKDILQITQIDAGRLELETRPTRLNELSEIVAVGYRALAQERKLILEHRPVHPGPLAWADSDYLSQALKNLLLNAILYTPEGGKVTVSVGQAQAQGRAWATATVADTGMGIPQDELPHIFERFFRGEAPRSMQISGTGLGLAIVQEIVALHGGWVTVESEVGVGSTFTVWLPLIEVQL